MDASSYQHVLVHGILPLVRDPASGTIRFGRLGIDRPEDCVWSAAELPEAGLTLHVFASSDALFGWATAAARFGGNTIEICRQPENFMGHVALEIDHSKQRAVGDGIDDAIALVVNASAPAEVMARMKHMREDVLKRNNVDLGRAAWKAAWQIESDVVERTPSVHSVFVSSFDLLSPADPLPYEIDEAGYRRRYSLARTDDGYAISWSWFRPKLDGDLRQEHDAALADLGAFASGDGLAISTSDFDARAIEKAAEIKSAISALDQRLLELQGLRNHVRESLSNDKMMSLLRRARQGAAVVVDRYGDVGMQINPRTGKPTNAASTHIASAFRGGWLDVSYPSDHHESNGIASNVRLPAVLTINAAGKALCDGDIDAAIANVRVSKAANNLVHPRNMSRPDPVASLAAAAALIEEEHRLRLATALQDRLESDTDVERILSGRFASQHGRTIMITAVLVGLATIEKDHRLSMVVTSPAPGMGH